MPYKLLNFPEAMRLAQIISKYVDTTKIKEMTGEQFAYNLFSEMSIEEVAETTTLLLKNNKKKDLEPYDIMVLCVESLIKNNFLELIDSYVQIGFQR